MVCIALLTNSDTTHALVVVVTFPFATQVLYFASINGDSVTQEVAVSTSGQCNPGAQDNGTPELGCADGSIQRVLDVERESPDNRRRARN
jgi:hypothetical protein